MKLSEFFPRLADLGEVRIIANNGTAVLEFNAQISNVTLGSVSWNFATEDRKEFHLYKAKVAKAKLFYGDHPRFKRVGLIEFQDQEGDTKLMMFLYGDAAAEGTPGAQAMQALIADFGENPEIEEETAAEPVAAGH
jgi:putative heme iron utilization protein